MYKSTFITPFCSRLVFMVILASTTGCSVSRDLNVSLRNKMTGQVKTLAIKTEGAPKNGTLAGTVSDGERVTGNYSAIVSGAQWGYAPQDSWHSTNANAQLIMTGNRGTSMTCAFTASASLYNPHGYGTCQDQNAYLWDMIF